MRYVRVDAVTVTHFAHRLLHAPKYLAAGAWPEAFEMPGKATKCRETLGNEGSTPNPLGELTPLRPRLPVAGVEGRACPACLFPLHNFQTSPPKLKSYGPGHTLR